jgi:cell division protein FtsL
MGQVYNLNNKKKKKPIRIRYIIILLLTVNIVYTLTAQYITIRKSRAQEAQIKTQIEEAKEENERLKEELERMQSDEYMEKLAREKLGLIKPGEIPFVDVGDNGEDRGD